MLGSGDDLWLCKENAILRNEKENVGSSQGSESGDFNSFIIYLIEWRFV